MKQPGTVDDNASKKTSAKTENLSSLLDSYERWCRSEGVARYAKEGEDWINPWKEPFVVHGTPPNKRDIKKLTQKFGALPASYVQVLEEVGNTAFRSGSYGLLRILNPKEVLELHKTVQADMDYVEGLREEIQQKNGVEFAKLLPVMAGGGTDGCWGLLDTTSISGRIFYWDTDQAAYMEDVFQDFESFIAYLLQRAKGNNPPRLT